MNARNALSALVALYLTVLPLSAQQQQQDGSAVASTKVTIHTVLRSGGMPAPGVPVYVVDQQWRGRPKPDGWLRASDNRIAKFAASQFVSSDPNGVITLDVPGGKLLPYLVTVGSGFRSEGVKKVDGKWLLRVDRLDQHAVRAVDEAGQPMAHFAVALHAKGYDRLIELTDARGIAVFGTKGLPSEVIAAPAGWVGPLEQFPVIDTKTSGRVKLVVPPFGTVRLRTLREGKPAPTRVFWGSLHDAPNARVKASTGRANCHGVEFKVVPVRGTLHAQLRAGPVTADIAIVGPRKAGEVTVVDVETDPVRPKLTFKVLAKGLAATNRNVAANQKAGAKGKIAALLSRGKSSSTASVRVRAQTDAGWFEEGRVLSADHRALVTFGHKPLHGKRLLRVEIELLVFGSQRKWQTAVDVDRPLTMSLMDLGEIEVPELMPTLRGRVVDWQGNPVARASIDIRPEPGVESHNTYRASSDQRGYFIFRGKPFRKPNGELARMVAEPSLGSRTHAQYGDACKPVAVGGEVILTLRRPTTGYVEVHLGDRGAVPSSLLQFSFLTNKGERHNLLSMECRRVSRTPNTYQVGPLPPGRGKLLVCLRPGCELLRVEDVDVAAGEVCRDERLRNLDLRGLATTAKLSVVDEAGRGLIDARIHYSKASDSVSSGSAQTDILEVTVAKRDDRTLKITAAGKEPLTLTEVTDGAVIRMTPRKRVRVSVIGLPKDLPRDRLAVMFRSVERAILLPWELELLADGDFAMLPVPPHGGYYLRFCVVKDMHDPSNGWSSVGQRKAPVVVGNFELKPIEYVVDETTIKRLQKMLR